MRAVEDWFHMERAAFGANTSKDAKEAILRRGIKYHNKVYKQLKLQMSLRSPELEGWRLLVEPWFRTLNYKLRSPDAVLVNDDLREAVVIEVKLNWKDGRDEKLICEYLGIVRSAFNLEKTSPLLITSNVRGYPHPPLTSLQHLLAPRVWTPAAPTPLMLVL